ncbi:MAG TPA: hypothetical protein VFG50_00285 [Rhodothermales bacterium]|nr:hypothetical protein [Rhodothermales bacterium]
MEASLEERILLYPELSLDDQLAIESFVAAHPEYEGVLEDVKAIGAFLEQASRFWGDVADDDVLVHYALARYMYDDAPPEHLREPLRRLEDALSRDPGRLARLERFVTRIETADRQSDALAQFEQLTGHRLTDYPKGGMPLHLDMAYFVGKIRLVLGNVSGARRAFQTVAERNGAHASEARRILAELDRSKTR